MVSVSVSLCCDGSVWHCMYGRSPRTMTRCTPCWPYVWCCTPCALTRASTRTCVRSMLTSSSACRKGQLLFTLVFTSSSFWMFERAVLGKFKLLKVILIITGLFCWLLKLTFRRMRLKSYSSGVHFAFSPNFVIFCLPFFSVISYTHAQFYLAVYF